MGFVDDVDFFAALDGREVHLLPYVSYLVDPPVAGGVQFDNIHEPAVVDRLADRAGVTWVAILKVEAIHRLGQDTGGGSFAAAPWAAEQVGVGHSALFG